MGWPTELWSTSHCRIGERAGRETLSSLSGAIVYHPFWSKFVDLVGGSPGTGPRILFQFHPVASQLRSALRTDREKTGLVAGLQPEEQLPDGWIDPSAERYWAADGAIAVSSFVKDGLVADGFPGERIRVVPYGGVPHDPRVQPAPMQSFLPSTQSAPMGGPLKLLWVGSLVYRKGPHHLVEALRLLNGGGIQLTIVTRAGGTMQTIFDHAPGARMLGAVSARDLRHIYATHHALVLPALAEGFGMVIAEALGAGLPVVSTTATGARDLVTHLEDGLLIPPGDPVALAEAIRILRDDRALLRELREGAQRKASCRTWEQFRCNLVIALADLEPPSGPQ
jgi:glycosyltransferase involved in cell wall biosynthesis